MAAKPHGKDMDRQHGTAVFTAYKCSNNGHNGICTRKVIAINPRVIDKIG